MRLHVGDDRDGAHTGRGERGDRVAQGGVVAAAQHELAALGPEIERDLAADAAAGAGHDRDPVAEAEVH